MAVSAGIVGIHHFNFTVENLDRTVDFYTRLLGFELRARTKYVVEVKEFLKAFGPYHEKAIAGRGGEYDLAVLELGGLRVEFMQFISPKTPPYPGDLTVAGSAHLAIAVKDIVEIRGNLESAGVKFRTGIWPINIPGSPPWRYCVLDDPDGIALELVEEKATVSLKEILGSRVREVRSSRKLSLRQLAANSGVSAAHLSQIERGEATPSLPVLVNLSAGLGVAPDYFMRSGEDNAHPIGDGDGTQGGPSNGVAPAGWTTVTSHQPRLAEPADMPSQSNGPSGQIDWTWLKKPQDAVYVVEARLAVGAAHEHPGGNEPGTEVAVVLSGAVRVDLAAWSTTLEAGSTARYDRSAPRRFSNVGAVPAALILIGYQE